MAVLAANPALFAAAAFLFGLAIGSFLNVVIYRLPVMLERQWRSQAAELEGRPAPPQDGRFNLVVPRSRCPACQAQIRGIHNVPILSWIVIIVGGFMFVMAVFTFVHEGRKALRSRGSDTNAPPG